jgi:hypothetical protein
MDFVVMAIRVIRHRRRRIGQVRGQDFDFLHVLCTEPEDLAGAAQALVGCYSAIRDGARPDFDRG